MLEVELTTVSVAIWPPEVTETVVILKNSRRQCLHNEDRYIYSYC